MADNSKAGKRGRRSKCTPEVTKIICENIELGLTYKHAAAMAGISEGSFFNWKKLGEVHKKGRYFEFVQAVKKANAVARFKLVSNIMDACKGGKEISQVTLKKDKDGNLIEKVVTTKQTLPVWQASAWILERRFPSEFGRYIQPQTDNGPDPFDQWVNDLAEARSKFSD